MSVAIGALMMNQQFSPGATQNGFQAPSPYTPSPYDISNAQAVIAGFASRLSNLEGAVRLQVSADTVISQILLTQDAALISSDKIAIVGEVTFADWHRTISGQIAGGIDPSITQIIGGVIKTGKVQSFDGLSWLNLDATGATPFIQCQSAVSIEANGNFTFGATAGAQLTWDGTNLSLGGNSLLAGTSTSTVVSNASYGSAAYSGLSNKLNKNAADVLGGNITFTTSGAFQIGTATWNGSSATGTGVIFNEYGIVAVNAGAIEFVLNGTTGAATFAGDISGASGNFAGNVNTGGYVYATGNYVGGAAIYGINPVASGVAGICTGSSGVGVYAESRNASLFAFEATSSSGSATNPAMLVNGYSNFYGVVSVRTLSLTTATPSTSPTGTVMLGTSTATSATAGSASALPATPAAYLILASGASQYKIAIYNA